MGVRVFPDKRGKSSNAAPTPARIRRDPIDSLGVAELMNEAGLTHGGFRVMSTHASTRSPTPRGGQWARPANRPWRPADSAGGGYYQVRRWFPQRLAIRIIESQAAVWAASLLMSRAPTARPEPPTPQVQACLALLPDLVDKADREVAERDAVMTCPRDIEQRRSRMERAHLERVAWVRNRLTVTPVGSGRRSWSGRGLDSQCKPRSSLEDRT
jgi:hypothetical protein